MCFTPKVPKMLNPVPAPSRADAADSADAMRRRLSVRKGYADSIKTSLEGSPDFGKSVQTPGLSAGTATTLGTSQ